MTIKVDLRQLFFAGYLSFFLFIGCTPQYPDGIKDAGAPETWMLSLEGKDSLVLKDEIFQKADNFCRAEQKYLMPVSKNYTEKSYQLTFRCLSSGDPELIDTDNTADKTRYKTKLGGYGNVKY